MRYKRFEDLPVWNSAIELAVAVYALTSKPQFKSHYGLKIKWSARQSQSQTTLPKASSVAQTMSYLCSFTSPVAPAGEVRSMCCLLDRLPDFTELKKEHSRSKEQS